MSWSVGELTPLLGAKLVTADNNDNAEASSELSISSSGKIDARPDVLHLRIVARAEAETSQNAREKSSQKIASVVQRVRSDPFFVIVEAETSARPVYTAPEPGQARRASYFASETYIVAEARNSRELVKRIPGLIEGADLFNISVFYTLQDRARYQTQAARLAIANAFRVATGIAEEAGVKITGVLKISTHQRAIRGYAERTVSMSGADDEAAKAGGLVELLVSDKTIPVTVHVDVGFAISRSIAALQKVRQAEPVSNTALVRDMARLTVENPFYRRVLQTTKEQQIVLMSLRAGEFIPEEVHDNMTQFIRVEQGALEVRVGSVSAVVADDEFVVVPSGVKHSIRQVGQVTAKLYVIYSSSTGLFDHKDQEIEERQDDSVTAGSSPALPVVSAASSVPWCDLAQ